jgi:hypothetical protein
MTLMEPTGMPADLRSALDEVRRELGEMAEYRLMAPFTAEETERYERLLGREQLLLLESHLV